MDTPVSATTHKMFTVNEVLEHGWEITKKYWVQYIMFGFAAGLIGMAISLISAMSTNGAWTFIWSVATIAFEMIVIVAMVRFMLNAVDGKPIVWKDLLTTDWKLLLFVLGTTVLVAIAVMVGFILVIVPGIIMACMFGFAIYIAVEKNMNPMDAMKASKNLTDGSKMDIFMFWLSVIGIDIALFIVPIVLVTIAGLIGGTIATLLGIIAGLCFIAAIIGAIIMSMTSNFGLAYIYRTLSHKKHEAFNVAK